MSERVEERVGERERERERGGRTCKGKGEGGPLKDMASPRRLSGSSVCVRAQRLSFWDMNVCQLFCV